MKGKEEAEKEENEEGEEEKKVMRTRLQSNRAIFHPQHKFILHQKKRAH